MKKYRIKNILLSCLTALSMTIGLIGASGIVFAGEQLPDPVNMSVSENEEIPKTVSGDSEEIPDTLSDNEAGQETVSSDETQIPQIPEETVSEPDANPVEEAAGSVSGDISEMLIQEGGFPDFEEASCMAAFTSLHALDDYDKACEAVAEAIGNWDGSAYISADISGYNIPQDRAGQLLVDVINDHAEFFYVDGAYSCSTDQSGNAGILSVKIKDGCTVAESDAFDRKVSEIIKGVDKTWTDLQKTMYIHDYLVTHVQYDLSYSRYSAEDAIVRGSAVCEGYSLAFKHLMNKLGGQFKCDYVGSNGINHAWNYLTVGGKQYYIDCTWDDPISGSGADGHFHEYNCRHEYFMLSRDKMHSSHKSTDWRNKEGDDIYGSVKGSSDLENAPWMEMDSPVPMVGSLGAYYEGMDDISLYTYDFKTKAKNKLTDYQARWGVWGGSGWWQANYSCLSSVGNYFTATTPTEILLVNSASGSKKTIYTLSDSEKAKGYIYGAIVEDGILKYQLYTRYDSGMKASGTINLSTYDKKGIGVVLDKTDVTIGINETFRLNAEVIPEDTENKTVIFKSLDESVAKVDSTGLVTGLSECDTVIEARAEAGGKSVYCTVRVRQKSAPPVYAVSFVNDGKTVYTEQVTEGEAVKNVPSDPEGTFAGWYSDSKTLWNPAMPVTGNMTLTAHFAAASAENASGAMNTAPVIKTGETVYLTKGQTYLLDKNYSWTSSDPASLQIIKKNKAKAKAASEGVSLTGTPLSQGVGEISCRVVIASPTLTVPSSVMVGEKIQLVLDKGSNGDHYDVAWYSSKPSVALVENGIVYGCQKGSCKVTAFVNGKAVTSKIKVVEKKAPGPVEGNELIIQPFQTVTLKFSDGFSLKKASWSSSIPLSAVKTDGKVTGWKNSVVKIGKDGKLKAVASGIVKLTVTSSSGEKTFKVKVAEPPVRTFYMMKGKSRDFTLMGVNMNKILWSSDASSVASIKKGKIKAGGFTGLATVSGNYSAAKNAGVTNYTVRVYTEDPSFKVTGAGQMNRANSAGTGYELSMKAGDVCSIRPEKDQSIFEPVLFRSKNNSVAFVDETGTVYAKNAGSAVLTAKVAGKTYTVMVSVTE
ncbi:MAG: Ig-like domain-containing protein [Lachnospiraceae bacterium]|nr:Ig-like domain-containing protein [Lachnospiraceae bacterium]